MPQEEGRIRYVADGSNNVHTDENGKFTDVIGISSRETEGNIANTSKDLNSTTLGYGLVFFHELGHTKYGGSHDDPENAQTEVGYPESLPNKIRRQLGSSYGQRAVYGTFYIRSNGQRYIPFSQGSLNKLQNKEEPLDHFVLLPAQ